MSESNDRKVILEALQKVMEEVEGVPKDGTNDFHRYKFVSEAGLVAHVRPALLRAGLFLVGPHVRSGSVQGPDGQGVTTFEVEYELCHVSGAIWPQPISILAQGCDRDSKGGYGDKGAYKGHTGAHKYLLLRLLNLVTGMEPEDDSPGQRTPRDEPGRTSRTSSAPPPARRTSRSNPTGARPTGGKITPEVAKAEGIYKAAFDAAEEVYGKEVAKDDQKKRWAPIDYAVEQVGFRRLKDVPATPENIELIKKGIDVFVRSKGEPRDGSDEDWQPPEDEGGYDE